jgi:hypothetical protein
VTYQRLVVPLVLTCGPVLNGCAAPPTDPRFHGSPAAHGPSQGRWYDAPPLHFRPWPYRRPGW